MDRPFGVAIIAILNFVSGAYLILKSLGLLGASAAILKSNAINSETVGTAEGLSAVSMLMLVIGIFTAVASIALWRMKSWAWYLAVVLNVIGLIHAISTGVNSGFDMQQNTAIVIHLIVLGYFFSVKKHFA